MHLHDTLETLAAEAAAAAPHLEGVTDVRGERVKL